MTPSPEGDSFLTLFENAWLVSCRWVNRSSHVSIPDEERRPPWSDAAALLGLHPEMQEPPSGHRWAGEWVVSVSSDTDAQGWRYARTWSAFQTDSADGMGCSLSSPDPSWKVAVRRRKWRRAFEVGEPLVIEEAVSPRVGGCGDGGASPNAGATVRAGLALGYRGINPATMLPAAPSLLSPPVDAPPPSLPPAPLVPAPAVDALLEALRGAPPLRPAGTWLPLHVVKGDLEALTRLVPLLKHSNVLSSAASGGAPAAAATMSVAALLAGAGAMLARLHVLETAAQRGAAAAADAAAAAVAAAAAGGSGGGVGIGGGGDGTAPWTSVASQCSALSRLVVEEAKLVEAGSHGVRLVAAAGGVAATAAARSPRALPATNAPSSPSPPPDARILASLHARSEEADALLAEVIEREGDVLRIAQSITELADVTRDLAAIVQGQSGAIDVVESNAGAAEEHVERGVEQLHILERRKRAGGCVVM